MMLQARALWAFVSVRWASARLGEEGSVVEKVILTAVFAALAIAVGAIIVAKVMDKANSINLN
jgi:integral membrane sensor domain MASE1